MMNLSLISTMFFKQAIILMVICNILIEGSPVSSSSAGLTELRPEAQNASSLHKKSKTKTCSTKGCKAAAKYILKNMDTSVDPCDDFYMFACGKFVEDTEVPDSGSASLFNTVADEVQNEFIPVIAEPVCDKDIRPFKLVKQFNELCMDRDRREQLGLQPMKKVLSRNGGWPLLESNWDEDSFDWKETMLKLHQENFPSDSILNFTIGPDAKNTSKWVIHIDQPRLGLKSETLLRGLEHPDVESYYSKMLSIAVEFGANRESASEDLTACLEFEINLAKISDTDEERSNRTKLYNPMSISMMQQKFSTFSWLKFINNLLAPIVEVNDNEMVIVRSPNYLQKLEELLNTTPKRTLGNYMMWKAVQFALPYLSENVRKYQPDSNAMSNSGTERDCSKECYGFATTSFPVALGSMYIRHLYKDDVRKDVSEMVDAIHNEMYKILSSADWMEEKTRKSALNKSDAMFSVIAYPDELLDDKKLEEYYSKVEITENEFFSYVMTMMKFRKENLMARLHKSVDRPADWTFHSETYEVNAGYSPYENTIHVLAAILKPFFFSKNRPKYVNYGGIGAAIGHEFTHGFDNEGRQYDSQGNKVDWWDPVTEERFNKKTQCLVEQYGNYYDKQIGKKLNGTNTLGENIADNGGIKQSYNAYQTWVKKNGAEQRLVGLKKYSPQQMFWISYANLWCTKYSDDYVKLVLKDVHPPSGFRVIGTLSNHEEFANDFKCPVGSKMNPKKKCTVW